VIVAETGGDMSRFTTPARLAARAGLAPGDNESAGKRKHGAARKGNQHLGTAMTESAWSAARTRSRPGARFRRLARRFGRGNEKKAAVVVAHTLICIAWAVMRYDGDYAEAGEDYYQQRDQRNHEYLVRHHQQALTRLGYQVTIIPPGDGRPLPGTDTPPTAAPGQAAWPSPHITGASQAGSAGAAARPLISRHSGLQYKSPRQVWPRT
jgi:transposase